MPDPVYHMHVDIPMSYVKKLKHYRYIADRAVDINKIREEEEYGKEQSKRRNAQ